MTPRLDTLAPSQRRLWDELAAIPPEFTLYGGTAIALYLGHRQSIDFDFFSHRHLDPARLVPAIPFLAGATILRREPDTLTCVVDRGGPVQLSFFGVPNLPRLGPPSIAEGIGLRVAPLLDLAGTKAAVVQLRAELKDYLDIDAIFRDGRVGLPLALSAAAALYGDSFAPIAALKALSYFEDGSVSALATDVRARLIAACRSVDLDRLPPVPTA